MLPAAKNAARWLSTYFCKYCCQCGTAFRAADQLKTVPVALNHAQKSSFMNVSHKVPLCLDAAHLDIPLEGPMPDNLPGTFSVHTDEPTFTKVQDVAGISQLMLCRDRDDAEPLASDEFGELDRLPTTAK
jgi:hypothetical protein